MKTPDFKTTCSVNQTPKAYECYEICADAWTDYMNNSLRNLITSGEGQPNPKEDITV